MPQLRHFPTRLMVIAIAIAVALSVLLVGVKRRSLSASERDDIKLAHRTLLGWCGSNRRNPEFVVFDQMGATRTMQALDALERDCRIGFTDRIWAHAAIWWTSTPFAGNSDRFNLWLFEQGSKVLLNFRVNVEDVRAFRVLATDHFAESGPLKK